MLSFLTGAYIAFANGSAALLTARISRQISPIVAAFLEWPGWDDYSTFHSPDQPEKRIPTGTSWNPRPVLVRIRRSLPGSWKYHFLCDNERE